MGIFVPSFVLFPFILFRLPIRRQVQFFIFFHFSKRFIFKTKKDFNVKLSRKLDHVEIHFSAKIQFMTSPGWLVKRKSRNRVISFFWRSVIRRNLKFFLQVALPSGHFCTKFCFVSIYTFSITNQNASTIFYFFSLFKTIYLQN